MSTHPDPATSEVIALLARIVERYTADYEAAAGRLDLTTIQAKVLVALKEPMPMHRIAERLRSERSNVTGIIDRLQARGLVERHPHERDRRIKNIVATEEGRRLADEFSRSLSFAADPLAGLDTGDCAKLRDLLKQMVNPEA